MRSFITEVKKTRGRLLGLMFPSAFLLNLLWICWTLQDLTEAKLAQGYYILLLNMPMINTIIVPMIIAAVASRICDTENKGATYKLLCTLQEKSSIFRNKLVLGGCYLLVFVIMQFLLILILGRYFRFSQPVPWEHIGYCLLSAFITGLVIMLLQEILSLMMDNQLYPLFIGLIGTFLGLFSWFFPNLPLRYLIPWGYYCVGCTINYNYYEETRVMDCYTVPFSWGGFSILIIFGILLYGYGRHLFLEKEV